MRIHLSVLGLPASALLLAGCGNSTPTPGTLDATACAPVEVVDHSLTSLPAGLSPRPGPEVLYAAAPRAPQLENTGIWQAAPILVSGASAYRCGEFLYQDWIYDDHGAAGAPDAEDPQESTAYLFSPKAGTLTYPADAAYANNAADLVEFRVKPLDGATAFRVTLNTLQDIERYAFTLALGGSEGAVAWPHGANVSSPATHFLTVHGTQAELLAADGGTALEPAPSVVVDLERRQVEVRVPHATWNPGQSIVRMTLGVGLWDLAGSGYLQPGETASATAPGGAAPSGAALFNLAFRASEPMPDFAAYNGRTIADAAALSKAAAEWWRERAQADALLLGDVSGFHAEVDFARLARGETDNSGVPTHGYINRLMASRFSFGQGADFLAECGGISAVRPCRGVMVGQLQPYTLYVPDRPPPAEGYGFTLLPHALSANYNQYLNSRHAAQMGDRGAGTIVATASGRGPDGFYYDAAQANLFEMWAEVARLYPLDPDWTVMGGVSMGGIGTFRVATRYPDLFARLHPIVAASSSDAQLPSLRNVPVTMWTSALDELQPLVSTEPDITALMDLGYRIESLRFDEWDHLTPSTNDSYGPAAEFLGEARVERDPPHVTYVLVPGEDSADFGLTTAGAYWLSGLTLRDEGLGSGTVDVVSAGFGLAEPALVTPLQSAGVLEEGNHAPSQYTHRVQTWDAPAAHDTADRLDITASNIATLVIDPVRARVSCAAQLNVTSDGPLQVTLAGCP